MLNPRHLAFATATETSAERLRPEDRYESAGCKIGGSGHPWRDARDPERGTKQRLRPMSGDGKTSTSPEPEDGAPHYHGHRERLRQRFREAGSEAVTDYELLELVLFRALPRRDLKPLAKQLLATFGSFAEALSAPRERLAEIKGLGEGAITDLKIVHAAANRLLRGQVKKRPVLSSWSHVLDYCRTAMAFENKEQFRVLFLDKRNALIADEVQQTGTVDHTPVYPREVVKRALELSATAIVLVHNHPTRALGSRSVTP